jgi:hypothetical protein
MWESRLSGSESGRVATRTTGEILWHRRETRRQTENTSVALPSEECPAYSKPFACGASHVASAPGLFRLRIHADVLHVDEIVTTGLLSHVLGGYARVFAATRRARVVDGATTQTLVIEAQERAWVGQLATLATTVAFATSAAVYR